MIYRVVGFIEYGNAMALLDGFVRAASDKELRIADGIVKDRPEFTVYTNLARRIEKASRLSEQPKSPRDNFARYGLEWVMALARIELGAMFAGFTSHPRPFHLVAPATLSNERKRTVYGAAAFAEMLLDGLRTHYWALEQDPAVANYIGGGVPPSHLVTYARRATVARHFVTAAKELLGNRLDGAQLAEINSYDGQFTRLQLLYLYCLATKARTQLMTNGEAWEYSGVTEACAPMIEAAVQELGITDTEWKGTRRKFSVATRIANQRDRLAKMLRALDPTLALCPCL